MFKIPEFAMPKTQKVTTVCNGKREVWEDREEAKDFFIRQTMSAEGEERDRYECIYIQLLHVGHRRYDTAPISQEVKNQYHDFVHQLLKGKKDHDGKETILHLSHKASDEYITYCNNYIENEIKASMCCCQDWGGKFHGLILRIACILHCADCCSRGVEPFEENVNHDTIVRSFDIAHYYRYQAIYGFSTNAPDGNIVKAEKIIQMFKSKNIKQGLKSELYHSCRCSLFPKATDFYLALDTLAEYGYIAYEDVTAANNKKTQMVYVNPQI